MAGKMDFGAAQEFARAWNAAREQGLTFRGLAEQLGVNPKSMAARRRRVEAALGIELRSFAATPETRKRAEAADTVRRFSIASERPTPEDELPIEELVARRRQDTARKLRADRLRELVEIKLDVEGPFGVALIGDPHIDNPGCNLDLLLRHTELIAQTDGMYAVCVGDVQDGWIGRLARLWAHQGIAARDSQRLVDYWLQQFGGRLIALCEGNHDAWLHGMSGQSPLDWIESRLGAVVERNGVRLKLTSADTSVTINLRHDFPGRSQYNAAHGPGKSQLFGIRDDVAVAGHTHEYGHGVRLDPETRKPMHAVRLGSYKHSDEYARTLGLLDNNVTECAVLLVDPAEQDLRHRTWIETNPFRAAKLLAWMREERRHGRQAQGSRTQAQAGARRGAGRRVPRTAGTGRGRPSPGARLRGRVHGR